MMIFKNILSIVGTISVTLLMVACGSMKNTATIKKTTPVTSPTRLPQTISTPKNIHPVSRSVIQEASNWIGTPYKYGGNDRTGVDCSGLVTNIYSDVLNIKLPRSSKEIATFCESATRRELIPGDLLFFSTTSTDNISHVGIFIGDNRMIHSSTSQGVIVSDLDSDYYRRTYVGAGFVDKYHTMVLDKVQEDAASDTKEDTSTITYVPVTSLPQRKSHNSSESSPTQSVSETVKIKSSGEPEKQTLITVISPSTTPDKTAEVEKLSQEEVRNAVLNKLIEQKLDSIFSK